ncbi:hypothetical protein [Agrococcus baldri]|uniref:hypothetical protein n=1 Tax=Agrococcus baldri TaxID=153730 RepID=UPI00164A02EE|nr:hypothetical protein [Agrococcus baldri]
MLRGDLDLDAAPGEGGARWGATIVAMPGDPSAAVLDRLALVRCGFDAEAGRMVPRTLHEQ